MSAGWRPFPDADGDYPGRALWLLADGAEPRLATLSLEDGWQYDTGATVVASGGPYPSLCHEVLPPALPGSPAGAHPEAAPGPVEVHPDESGLGGWCLTLGPRGGAVASGIARPDADLMAELWNRRLGKA